MAIKSGIMGFGESPYETSNRAAALYPSTLSFWDRVKDQVRINPNGTLEQWYGNSVSAPNPPDWNNYIMNFGSMVYRPPVPTDSQTIAQVANQVAGNQPQPPQADPNTFRGAVTNLAGGMTSNLNTSSIYRPGMGGGMATWLPIILIGGAYFLFFRKKKR